VDSRFGKFGATGFEAGAILFPALVERIKQIIIVAHWLNLFWLRIKWWKECESSTARIETN
jgi:hypothetical protein